MQKLFENWRNFRKGTLNEEERPTSPDDPRIFYNDGTMICYDQKDGTGYCGSIKTSKAPLTQSQDTSSFKERPRDWKETCAPMAMAGLEHTVCTSGPYAGMDEDAAWKAYANAYMNTEEPDDELPRRGRRKPEHVDSDEDWQGDAEGRAVHLAAKDVCGNDRECYTEYVLANDPELKDVRED